MSVTAEPRFTKVNTGADPTPTLLQNCAGSPGKYPDASKFFLLTSASQMVTTFKEIGTKLAKSPHLAITADHPNDKARPRGRAFVCDALRKVCWIFGRMM